MRNQRAINLRADLDPKDRADVYRSFLLYCITGQQLQVKGVPANSPMQDHTATEFTRLAQLGDILGLNQMEIAEVCAPAPLRPLLPIVTLQHRTIQERPLISALAVPNVFAVNIF